VREQRGGLRLDVPTVHVGPRANGSLRGERGLLLGARRPAWIDVLEFDALPASGARSIIDSRFLPHPHWDVVGVSLSASELRHRGERLLRELVPGDVLMTERGPRFHAGWKWIAAPLIRFER
jgi:hypothetical protein